MPIIFGLGTGRSGTQSLAKLLNEQDKSVCFHEINPASMCWKGSEETVFSLIRDFDDILKGGRRAVTVDYTSPNRGLPLRKLRDEENIEVIGDIGFYYLPYAEAILNMGINVRFPCMKRPKDEVVHSYINKFKVHNGTSKNNSLLRKLLKKENNVRYRNPFAAHDGKTWVKDGKWDKCYPKMEEADSLEEALDLYWEMYYQKVGELANIYPEKVRVFSINELNTESGRDEILNFCGCPRK